ncbi:MAG: beta-methylgalactoside transporter [Oscillospiraceae bacterium]|jgi:methyl-galactoside transport system permease protein|nr:beta-methylgalactoside transporter [Oscillospiraceae bacterium]
MQSAADTRRGGFSRVARLLSNNIIIVGIILLTVAVGIMRKNFFSEANFRNLLSNTAIRFIIAVGVSGCLITRGTDLSAGRVAGLSACLSAILLQRLDYVNRFYKGLPELPIVGVLGFVLLICAVIGAVNGAVVAYLKVPPFIATLGMQTLVYGICLVYTGAQPIGSLRADYAGLATGYIGTKMISYPLIIAIVVGMYMWFLYNKMRHGKYMYAIGGNESAAEVAGVNVGKSKVTIYMLAAILYGLCGFLLAAKSGGASVNTAQGYELEAIAGCTIGGVSVNGGVGRISGILIGVLVFELLKIALQFLGVKSEFTYVVQGVVIILAVALDIQKYLNKK